MDQAVKPSTPSFVVFTVRRDVVNVDREHDRYRSNRFWSSNVKLMIPVHFTVAATGQELGTEVHGGPERGTDIGREVEAR